MSDTTTADSPGNQPLGLPLNDQLGQAPERESVDDALMIVESYGPWGADINDAHRRQIVLADEVKRLRHLYEMAVRGRADMRAALRLARWYCLDRDGVAMLCKDEADAREQVIENSDCWPNRAPYRTALLGDVKALEAENAALKREAYTWSKAAEHYAKPLQPLDPLDVEELWDVANADPYVDEVHQAFARLVERKHGIGG